MLRAQFGLDPKVTVRKVTAVEKTAAAGEAAGYVVTRAAASLGEWDLIGLGPQGAVVAQVKTRDWPGTLERAALHESCPWPYVTGLIHRWRAIASASRTSRSSRSCVSP